MIVEWSWCTVDTAEPLSSSSALCCPQTGLVLVKCSSDYQAYFQLQGPDTGSIQLFFQLCSHVQQVEGKGTNTRWSRASTHGTYLYQMAKSACISWNSIKNLAFFGSYPWGPGFWWGWWCLSKWCSKSKGTPESNKIICFCCHYSFAEWSAFSAC